MLSYNANTKYSALIIGMDLLTKRSLARALNRIGFSVQMADNYWEARFRTENQRYTVIIAEHNAKRFKASEDSGLNIRKSKLNKDTPIISVTSEITKDQATYLIFLCKVKKIYISPVSPTDICAYVEEKIIEPIRKRNEVNYDNLFLSEIGG